MTEGDKRVLQQGVVEIAAGAGLTTAAHLANGLGLSTAASQIGTAVSYLAMGSKAVGLGIAIAPYAACVAAGVAAAVGVAKVCEWMKK